ncbi:hypothetical protein TGMAS_277930D [Toxoplasma gondii MAS]|uniref:Uncharacterized protein n=2 Tax=Toxoplasma gondii TaxID=5811 RepID=A0A086QJ01_TOXGO|nr:hypothetical protein TGMAS_277930D [Toxoplasma gondii MAS]PUA85177.1 hypothetical protein TGBR9_277930D [Toxoplasma gondii TgCATBr9]
MAERINAYTPFGHLSQNYCFCGFALYPVSLTADKKERRSQEGVGKESTPKVPAESTVTENSGKVSGQLHTNAEQEGMIRRNSQLDVLDKKIRELRQDIKKKVGRTRDIANPSMSRVSKNSRT